MNLSIQAYSYIYVITQITCMKTISIRDDVYERLLRLKEEGESFSDVIEKLLEKKGFSLEEYFGCLKDSPALDKLAEYSRRIRE